jgi:hypothetical protein
MSQLDLNHIFWQKALKIENSFETHLHKIGGAGRASFELSGVAGVDVEFIIDVEHRARVLRYKTHLFGNEVLIS